MAKRVIFTVTTPLGERVVLTRDRWRELVRFKHPALDGRESDVRDCLRDPERVRASGHDATAHLYYRPTDTGYVCVVVGKDDSDNRFVVTAYFTAKLKQGTDLWTK